MKRFTALALFLSLAATTNASQLSIRFAGPAADDEQNASSYPGGGPILVEVLWTQTEQEALNPSPLDFVGFFLTSVPESPDFELQGERVDNDGLVVSNFSSSLPNWAVSGTPGTVGGPAHFQVGATTPAAALTAPGTTVIGTFEVAMTIDVSSPLNRIYIQRSNADATPQVAGVGGIDYDFIRINPDGYRGEYNIGTGFAGSNIGLHALPLTVYYPEPASLGLLAIGAALICRRKGRKA